MRRRNPLRASANVLAPLFIAVLATTAAASDNDDIYGLWKTPKNDGRVIIAPCGERVCARIVDGIPLRANPDQRDVLNPDASKRNRRVKGLFTLEGYVGGPTEWHGGSVYDPQTGDSSDDSTLRFIAPRTLVVRGCRLFFCRSETWTRLSSVDGVAFDEPSSRARAAPQ